MNWLARLTLLTYPKGFRRDFGPEYLQTVADVRTHARPHRLALAGRLIADALTTAPSMRWENLMTSNKRILTIIAAVAAAFGLLIGAPMVALPLLAVFALLVIGARRNHRPVAVEAAEWGERWYVWLSVAAGLFLIGIGALAIDGDDDLSSPAWAVWILSWLAAAIVAVVGLGIGVTRLLTHRR